MVWVAKNLEEPLRGFITLAAVVIAWIVIPWVTDIEGLLRNRMDMASTPFLIMYWAVVVLVVVVCGVAGYYFGKAVTKPLRNIAERHDLKELQRLRKLQS
jgi:hypothetical protein